LDSIDVELKVTEVVLADAELKDFVNHWKQVMQRPDGLERNSVRRAEDPARGGQDQGVFDDSERYVAIIKSSGQQTVVAPDGTRGCWYSPIRVEDLANVIGFGDFHVGSQP
jgi:hypothetical protein